jgi:hypothetical protein
LEHIRNTMNCAGSVNNILSTCINLYENENLEI